MNDKVHAHIRRMDGYRFEISFDEWDKGAVQMDEPVPLGHGSAPNASMMLSSAVGHCLSASLLFCMGKSRSEVEDLEADVETSLVRNERGRWRIEGIKVTMKPTVKDSEREKLARCLSLFEDFCIVTASVREGIKVEVDIREQSA